MFIDQYYSENDQGICFTRQQGSDFAKNIADDFNPLHDINAKRFCVPGDLLFSLVLSKYGLSQRMQFTFSEMVGAGVSLKLPSSTAELVIKDDKDKNYLSIERSGDCTSNSQLIDNFSRRYVAFSGHSFPHILLPLLKAQNVMINPARPMVIYESMVIELNRFDLSDVELCLDHRKTKLEAKGKRGHACLAFTLLAHDEIIGTGEKHMLLSGLKPYEQSAVDDLVNAYNLNKNNHKQ